jgi:uncharacterized protein
MAISAHLWTFATRIRPIRPRVHARSFRTQLQDPTVGEVPLTGLLRREEGSPDLLLFVHGIGGCASARYACEVAATAHEMGVSCLRMNLRGCDRQSPDFYHAGLASDLGAMLAAPELADFTRIVVLGYSMGGHLALRYATEELDPRVAAVAAVCAPLDLAPAAARIDRPGAWPYRRYVLRNLNDIYRNVARLRPVPLPPEETLRIKSLREWDERVVAPRWGFDGAADYYARASVAPRLGSLRVPALLVAVERDPMVPGDVVRPVVARRGLPLEVIWAERGGHVGFPLDLDLGQDGPRGIEGQTLGWLLGRAR